MTGVLLQVKQVPQPKPQIPLKRSSARRRTEEELANFVAVPRFLGREMEVEDEGPFDPLDGQGEECSLYVVRGNYDDPYALFYRLCADNG
jgi:hypothetical protein